MRSRRRKTSLARNLFLWTICLALVGWGMYWTNELRQLLPEQKSMAPEEVIAEGDQGDVAVGDAPLASAGLLPTLSMEAFADEGSDAAPLLEPTTYPAFDAALSAEELSSRGMQLLNNGEMVAGRFALNAALARCGEEGEARAGQLRGLLAGLNVPVFLGSAVLPDDPAARLVDIQEGDSFVKIAHTFGVPAGLLPVLNPSLNTNNLKPGTGIKVVQGPFHVQVVKHAGRMDLFARELYVTSLRVAFPEGNLLPRGEYQISSETKLQVGAGAATRTWIGFHGAEVASGWMYGSAGPRGNTTRDLATGMQLSDEDMKVLFVTLVEGRSRLRVEP